MNPRMNFCLFADGGLGETALFGIEKGDFSQFVNLKGDWYEVFSNGQKGDSAPAGRYRLCAASQPKRKRGNLLVPSFGLFWNLFGIEGVS